MDYAAFACFREEGIWLKGNLHSHTTNSDGEATPVELVDWYRSHGYDFLAITDHDVITDVKKLDGGDMLLIPGVEFGYQPAEPSDWFLDMLAINVTGLPEFADPEHTGRVHYDPSLDPQRIIDWVNEAGGVAVMCHPYFMINMMDPYLRYQNYLGMEAFNYVCQDMCGRGHQEPYWDAMLYRGKRLWGFATDDSHRADFGHAWIQVKAKERSVQGIMEAIRQGHFYATTGIQIYDLTYEQDVVTITMDRPCNAIAFPWPDKVYSVPAKDNVAESEGGQQRYVASVPVKPGERYLRIELIDDQGNKAYTNPIYFA